MSNILGGLLDIPIVGDIAGGLIGHASSSELQEDTQAHSAAMFEKQKQHEIEQWGRESQWSSAQAQKQYQRQRNLLQDSPGLQMQGLKSAGLNPILAATGGFKSPAGGSMPIPSARASASAKGGGAGIGAGAKVQLGQARLLNEQARLTSAQKNKVVEETKYVGQKTDIAEPIAKLMQVIAGMLEQSNIDRNTTSRIMQWLESEIPDKTKPMTKQQQIQMLEKAKRKFPQLKGVENAKRKIFGEK